MELKTGLTVVLFSHWALHLLLLLQCCLLLTFVSLLTVREQQPCEVLVVCLATYQGQPTKDQETPKTLLAMCPFSSAAARFSLPTSWPQLIRCKAPPLVTSLSSEVGNQLAQPPVPWINLLEVLLVQMLFPFVIKSFTKPEEKREGGR